MWTATKIAIFKERIAMTYLKNFCREEQGQDLIEYTLLMAFVALASAALFLGAGGSIKGIWTTSNSQLAAANAQAS
ncbi:MAG: Flp family type IVb pilin [Terriglobia bacterium]|nr:MAG: Flp family type IVb pilin [Terriglobia bacterium]